MIEPGRELDLSQETVRAKRCGEIGVQHFQRDEALVLPVLCEIDGCHAATAQLPVDDIRIRERGPKLLDRKRSLRHLAFMIV